MKLSSDTITIDSVALLSATVYDIAHSIHCVALGVKECDITTDEAVEELRKILAPLQLESNKEGNQP